MIYIWFFKIDKCITAWKVSVFGVILVRIFSHSDWIRRDTPYLSVFPCSVQMREKADQNNSKYGHFLRSDYLLSNIFLLKKNVKCFSFINALRNKVYLCGITSIVVEALFRDILRMIGHMSSNVRALIFTRGKRNQQNIITQALSFKHLQVLGVSIGKVIFWLCWRYLKLAFGVKNHHNSHNQENKGQLMKVDSC